MKAETIATLTLLFDARGRTLLGEKQNAEMGNGLLNALGGKWEAGETILDCAVREPWQEARVTILPRDLFHLGSLECYVGAVLSQRVHVYGATNFVGTPQETREMKNFNWCWPDKLPLDRMHEGDRFWFPKAARRQKFRMQIWYKRPGAGYIKHVEGDYNS